ncbi:hypothetical protein I7I48_03148 [Histoplasma ohiense]|nr:hypothetical protein I7I48_03148 [Histoplasma ohiense (nom. inval.)]
MCDTPLLRCIMRGRVFIFVGVVAEEDMANHKSHLHCLIKQLNTPHLVMLSAQSRAEVNALWFQCWAVAESAGVQVLKAVVVSGPSRAEALEKEGVLKMMSFGGSAVEELAGKRLVEEELAGEPMEEVVEAPVAAAVPVVPASFANLPLTSVEQRERVPWMVEK